jgi:hypothetical protein
MQSALPTRNGMARAADWFALRVLRQNLHLAPPLTGALFLFQDVFTAVHYGNIRN